MMARSVSLFALGAAAAVAMALPAHAVDTRYGSQVTACSKKHSGKCVSGAVKSYNLGQKVRLPGGTWVDCAGDCQDKLRVKTVDFWYDQMLRQ